VRRLALLAFLGLLLIPASADAAFPGANGKIAFSSNRDGDTEIYTVNPDGSGLAQITHNSVPDTDPAWSPDGTRLTFVSNHDIWVMDADGANAFTVTTNPNTEKWNPGWSPDGLQLVFSKGAGCYADLGCYFEMRTINVDGTGNTVISSSCGSNAVWSPDGTRFAANNPSGGDTCGGRLFTMAVGGGTRFLVCCPGAGPPNWAPDQTAITTSVFCGTCTPIQQLVTVHPDGTGLQALRADAFDPAWSPDGTKIAYLVNSGSANYAIRITGADGVGEVPVTDGSWTDRAPDWQPLPINYPRPKGASPAQVFLVPAYAQCTGSGNRTHGAPLAYPSCAPPSPASSRLTVGTPDANGQGAKSIAEVFYATRPGDVAITAEISDVRSSSDLSDYTGELRVVSGLRITDRNNTPYPGGAGPGTVADMTLPLTVSCAPSADTSIGSACNVSTTVNALFPGAITAGQRAVWQLGQVSVEDSGADGDADTTGDNTLFMRQGIFVP
jgi:dipeptidyl aminopeptidase/acylaminoacyl peptidase